MVKDKDKNNNNSSNSLVFGRWPQTKISMLTRWIPSIGVPGESMNPEINKITRTMLNYVRNLKRNFELS